MQSSNLFVIIDTSAIVHRAYHAYPATLRSVDGVPTNAVFGFTSMLLDVMKKYKPQYLLAAEDTGKPTFRHEQFPAYKAHRKPVDRALIDQFPLVETTLEAFNIPHIKQPGYEADDIIGTLAERFSNGEWKYSGIKLLIVSGDKDLLQLVGPNVNVVLPKGSFRNLIVYDRETTYKMQGIYPEQVIDYKAMVGDPSDNIPGIKGIGKKTAMTLLQKYGTLDNIYKHLNELTPRQQTLFAEGVEQAEISRDLATIYKKLDFPMRLEDAILKDYSKVDVIDLFAKLSFKSLLTKLPDSRADIQPKQPQDQMSMFGTVGNKTSDDNTGPIRGSGNHVESTIKDILSTKYAKNRRYLIYHRDKPDMALIGICKEDGEILWADLRVHSDNDKDMSKLIADMKENRWITHGWEEFVTRLGEKRLINLLDKKISQNVADVALTVHIIDAGMSDLTLSGLTFRYLARHLDEYTREHGGEYIQALSDLWEYFDKLIDGDRPEGSSGDTWKTISNRASKYLTADRVAVRRYISLETLSSLSLAMMENRGIRIDLEKVAKIKEDFEQKLSEIVARAYEVVGHEFTISSPKQVAELLYDELNLWQYAEGGKKKRTRSTRADVLTELIGAHPVVRSILEYREISKLLSTYIEPYLQDAVGGTDGFAIVHTNLLQTGTSSGRFASRNPNLQNLPASGPGLAIRSAFVAGEEYDFVALDYSQIELRIFAHLSRDKAMIQDFVDGKDIHTATASRIFNKSESKITKDERKVGKIMNFAIIYGQTKYGLAKLLRIPIGEAERTIQNYMQQYPGVSEYIEKAKTLAVERGWVETMFGRRRYLSGTAAMGRMERESAMREAINMPIQGSNADIMRLAMLDIADLIKNDKRYKNKVYPILQVHDELIYEADTDISEEFLADAQSVMKRAVLLNVPLEVHALRGKNLEEVK